MKMLMQKQTTAVPSQHPLFPPGGKSDALVIAMAQPSPPRPIEKPLPTSVATTESSIWVAEMDHPPTYSTPPMYAAKMR